MSSARFGRRSALARIAGTALTGLAGTAAGGASARAGGPRLEVDRPRISLPAGRSVVEVALPGGSFASVAAFGPREALLGLAFTRASAAPGVSPAAPLDEDGLLPRVVSFATEGGPALVEVVVDVVDPVDLALGWASLSEDREPTPKGLRDGLELARPLVGFPAPTSLQAGYAVSVPGRYAFARIDVVRALLSAFEKTRRRFKSDPIYVGDASQWDGRRPKSDLSQPRHISHEGGCDVDLGLPATDTFPSTLREHCRPVRIDPEHLACSPGTARGVDFDRLAFLLGTLVDEGPTPLVKVFLDDAYRREVMRGVERLFERRLLKDAARSALGDDGILVASPWHTDHVHVRFGGEKARGLFEVPEAAGAG